MSGKTGHCVDPDIRSTIAAPPCTLGWGLFPPRSSVVVPANPAFSASVAACKIVVLALPPLLTLQSSLPVSPPDVQLCPSVSTAAGTWPWYSALWLVAGKEAFGGSLLSYPEILSPAWGLALISPNSQWNLASSSQTVLRPCPLPVPVGPDSWTAHRPGTGPNAFPNDATNLSLVSAIWWTPLVPTPGRRAGIQTGTLPCPTQTWGTFCGWGALALQNRRLWDRVWWPIVLQNDCCCHSQVFHLEMLISYKTIERF